MMSVLHVASTTTVEGIKQIGLRDRTALSKSSGAKHNKIAGVIVDVLKIKHFFIRACLFSFNLVSFPPNKIPRIFYSNQT